MLQALVPLAVLLLAGSGAAQDVIAASEGSTASQAGSAPVATDQQAYGGGYASSYGHHGAVHHSSPGMSSYGSAEEYNRAAYSGSGAGPWTMWIMMGSVFVGYSLLFSLMFYSCTHTPHMFTYAVHHDVEMSGGAAGAAGGPKPDGANLPPHLAGPVAELDKVWRNQFVAKVYGILCVQLAITVVICFGMMQIGGYGLAMWILREGYWTKLASFVGSIVLICWLMAVRNQHPKNLIVLGLFTVCMSYMIGMTCTLYAAAGMGVLVVEAFAITSLLFIGLTLFVMYSGIDFSFLGLFLPALVLILMIWGLFAMFAFESYQFRQVYALFGCIVFVGYILFDTTQITTYLAYDEYVVGAINLYLDFINLFIFILQLLAGGRRD